MEVAPFLLGFAILQPTPDEGGAQEPSSRSAESEPETTKPNPEASVPEPQAPLTADAEPEPEPKPEFENAASPRPAPTLPVAAPPAPRETRASDVAERSEWLETREPDQPEPEQFRRRGAFFSAAVGIAGCAHACPELGAGGSGRLEFGYRWNFISTGVSGSLGGASFSSPDSDDDDIVFTVEGEGSIRFLSLYPFLRLNPIQSTRLDPFFSFGFGYHRFTEMLDASQGTQSVRGKAWREAPAAHFAVGLPIFATERLTVGPRFDKAVPFQGRTCLTFDGDPPEGESKCRAWDRQLDGLNEIDRRLARRARERPWSLALEIRATF